MHIPEEQSQHLPWEDTAVSRRDWLRKLALAGAGATGLAGVAPTVVEGKAMAPAPLAQTTGMETMWTHGASIQLETRALEASTARRGASLQSSTLLTTRGSSGFTMPFLHRS